MRGIIPCLDQGLEKDEEESIIMVLLLAAVAASPPYGIKLLLSSSNIHLICWEK